MTVTDEDLAKIRLIVREEIRCAIRDAASTMKELMKQKAEQK